jgi:cobalt transporter subunit CbtB
MTTATDSVYGRVALARTELTPAQMAAGLAFAAALGALLLFAQEPALHDSMHNFRHAAGVTCH